MRIHWDKVTRSERGNPIRQTVKAIGNFPERQIWRWAQVGDLPGVGDAINGKDLRALVRANDGKRGFTYTHKPTLEDNLLSERNREHVRAANEAGFTINLSSEGWDLPDQHLALGIGPVVTVLPSTMDPEWKIEYTTGGTRIVRCPAEYRDEVSCSNCGGKSGPLCQRRDRDYIVGFTAHGFAKKQTDDRIRRSGDRYAV